MYFTCDRPEQFLPEVTEALTAFENRLIAEQDEVVGISTSLFDAGKAELAHNYLTRYSAESGLAGLRLGNSLLASIEARTEVLFGYRAPEGNVVSELTYDRIDCLAKTQ